METRKDNYNRFVCIVAGDNPDALMEPYDSKIKTNPYILYKKEDAKRLREITISTINAILELQENNINKLYYDALEEEKEYYESLTDDEFFENEFEDYEHDDEGNVITSDNPNGKYSSYLEGKVFSIPFILKDGTESFSARKGDVDWDKMHGNNKHLYERVWEMVMENSEPLDEGEERIKANMSERTNYLRNFETKENYVASNTSFWGYAFLSDETGWVELEDTMNQFVWINTFYDLRIKMLPDDTLLTIFECFK